MQPQNILKTRQRLISHVKSCFDMEELLFALQKASMSIQFKGQYGHMTNNASLYDQCKQGSNDANGKNL